jgi:hypothetical protein
VLNSEINEIRLIDKSISRKLTSLLGPPSARAVIFFSMQHMQLLLKELLKLLKTNLNYAALVRKKNIPTERPPLGKVSANFCG